MASSLTAPRAHRDMSASYCVSTPGKLTDSDLNKHLSPLFKELSILHFVVKPFDVNVSKVFGEAASVANASLAWKESHPNNHPKDIKFSKNLCPRAKVDDIGQFKSVSDLFERLNKATTKMDQIFDRFNHTQYKDLKRVLNNAKTMSRAFMEALSNTKDYSSELAKIQGVGSTHDDFIKDLNANMEAISKLIDSNACDAKNAQLLIDEANDLKAKWDQNRLESAAATDLINRSDAQIKYFEPYVKVSSEIVTLTKKAEEFLSEFDNRSGNYLRGLPALVAFNDKAGDPKREADVLQQNTLAVGRDAKAFKDQQAALPKQTKVDGTNAQLQKLIGELNQVKADYPRLKQDCESIVSQLSAGGDKLSSATAHAKALHNAMIAFSDLATESVKYAELSQRLRDVRKNEPKRSEHQKIFDMASACDINAYRKNVEQFAKSLQNLSLGSQTLGSQSMGSQSSGAQLSQAAGEDAKKAQAAYQKSLENIQKEIFLLVAQLPKAAVALEGEMNRISLALKTAGDDTLDFTQNYSYETTHQLIYAPLNSLANWWSGSAAEAPALTDKSSSQTEEKKL